MNEKREDWFVGLSFKYPQKTPDIVYHGSFPKLNPDKTFKIGKTLKNGKEIETVLRNPPNFTIRFREIENNIIAIGWSVASSGDIFSKKIGRNKSFENLLTTINAYHSESYSYLQNLIIPKLRFMHLLDRIPIKLFANLQHYIKKFVKHKKIEDIYELKFIIKTDKRCDYYGNYLAFHFEELGNFYMPSNFYNQFIEK